MGEHRMTHTDSIKTFPGYKEIMLKAHLYDSFNVNLEEDADKEALADLLYCDGSIDTHCIHCNQTSIFQFNNNPGKAHNTPKLTTLNMSFRMQSDQTLGLSLTGYCSRNKQHITTFHFILRNNILMKVGQYPSIADTDTPELNKYRKVLSSSNFSDLKRAIGLKSHGVGAGSLVYLRRVFESLIEEAHIVAKVEHGWDEKKYAESRLGDKIQMLESHLPKTILKLKIIYGIMSKGIHSLSEQQCLSFFEDVRLAIEIILDEKLIAREKAEQQQKEQKLLDSLSQTKSDLDKL
jgi:hypothetical protein